MASKLQCEICGGKLVGKPGGIFECENCGTEYSTEWAKAKIQEITGTVKVEGTVEVTGKVQVDTAANKDNLLKRGFMLLEESTSKNPTWKTADEYFDKVLDIDAECGEAYLGKLMIEAKVRKRSDLASSYVGRQADWENSSFFQKAFQYGNIALRHELTELVRKKTYDKAENYAHENNAASLRKAADLFGQIPTYRDAAKRQNECLAKTEQGMTSMQGKREKIRRIQNRIGCGTNHVVGVKTDGTVVAVGDNRHGQCNVKNWRNIVAVAAGAYHTVALRSDGTVVSTKYLGDPNYNRGQDDVSRWIDIVAIGAGSVFTAGLKSDGTVIVTGSDPKLQEVRNWQNITLIFASNAVMIGIDSSGAILTAGGMTERERETVRSWTNIAAVDFSGGDPIGLKEDGTLVSTFEFIQRKLSSCADIVSIACDSRRVFGLQKNGTVLSVEKGASSTGVNEYDVSGWNDIAAIGAGYEYLIGLRKNGAVVAAGSNAQKIHDVLSWRLFNNVDTIENEIKTICEQRRNQLSNELAAAANDKNNAEIELANLKGLFSGKRRKELEAQIAEDGKKVERLQAELKALQ